MADNARYFVFGRYTGLLPYYLPAFGRGHVLSPVLAPWYCSSNG